jgi:hypothetical protein
MKFHIGMSALLAMAICLGVGTFPTPASARGSKSKNSNGSASKKFADADESDNFETKEKVPTIGEYAQIAGYNMLVLQGAGLVVGLKGAGEDPPPNQYREAVLEEMKRRGVEKPNDLLKSLDCAVVVVTAYLPPLIRVGDHFDVEVSLPPGSKVKSLNGGWLLESYLSEGALVPGRGYMKGHEYGKVKGPILVSAGHDDTKSLAGVLRRGRIVAGGTSTKERNLEMYLRNDFRSERNAYRIAQAIGARFYDYDQRGRQRPLAEAKTDQKIELRILPRYRDNYPRYLDVIRKIAFRETDVARHLRMKALSEDLLNVEKSATAAIKLEAIGESAIPILKSGLASKQIEIRFNSAVALAYLGDASGLDVLADAAKNEYAFRIFALAAMSCLEEAPEANVKLRELMNVESAETRYGAFRALTTLDENDPFVRGQKKNDQFKLHILDTTGSPMVHLTNYRKAEVVLFGADQRLHTPLAAHAGAHIMVMAEPGSDTVVVGHYEVGREVKKKEVSTRLVEVIDAACEFGATFPDIAELLWDANSQRVLAGRLEIDALPKAGRYYVRKDADPAGKSTAKKTRVGHANTAPNLFSIDTKSPSSKKKPQDLPAVKADHHKKPSKDPSAVGSKEGSPVKTVAQTTGAPAPATDLTKEGPAADDGTPNSAGNAKTAPDSKSSGVGVVQASAVDQPGVNKVKPAAATLEDSDDPPPQTSPSRFRWFSFFDFGDRGVSGNKEP